MHVLRIKEVPGAENLKAMILFVVMFALRGTAMHNIIEARVLENLDFYQAYVANSFIYLLTACLHC